VADRNLVVRFEVFFPRLALVLIGMACVLALYPLGQVATELELWQEAFRSVEDIHGLMTLVKKSPKPQLMAIYYAKLTKIFWKSENHLYHAYAWYVYSLSRAPLSALDTVFVVWCKLIVIDRHGCIHLKPHLVHCIRKSDSSVRNHSPHVPQLSPPGLGPNLQCLCAPRVAFRSAPLGAHIVSLLPPVVYCKSASTFAIVDVSRLRWVVA